MFRLRNCDTEAEKLELLSLLKQRLEQLPSLIPQIKDFEVGLNVTEVPWAFDIVLNAVFSSKADLDLYTIHPAHQDFVSFNKDKTIAKSVVDFYF